MLGTDLVAWDAIRPADYAIMPGKRYGALFTTGGGRQKLHGGDTKVDLDRFALLAGVAVKSADNAPLVAFFLEAGTGNYDAASSQTTGSGSADYLGAGLLLYEMFANGLYWEASFRAGGAKTDYKSGDLRDILGRPAQYDYSAPYYGVHAGIGCERALSGRLILDAYAKYLWTQHDGKTVEILEDPVDFAATNSHRIRPGARLIWSFSDILRLHFGTAYDYEFDGKARASAHGYDFGSPDLKGGTAICETGLRLHPLPRWTLDASAQANTGKRDGFAGLLKIQWDF